MAKHFSVSFIMTCSGTVEVQATSAEEAKRLVEEWPLSELARQADTGDTEILEAEWEGI